MPSPRPTPSSIMDSVTSYFIIMSFAFPMLLGSHACNPNAQILYETLVQVYNQQCTLYITNMYLHIHEY